MKHLFLFLFTLTFLNGYSQTTIFTENFGNPSSITLVSSYTGFQNYGAQSYTGNADVRVTTPSSGWYTGASGNGNLFITNTLNTNLTISGINTLAYTNLSLSFGLLKTTNNSNCSELGVQVSSNGTTWTDLVYASATGSGTSNKYYVYTPTGMIPSTSNLRIRFIMKSVVTGLQFRVDDVKLIGSLNPILPIKMVNFYVERQNNTNKLSWTTVSEINLNRFEIERSNNLNGWEVIGILNSTGDKTTKQDYFYYDENPLFGLNYYRIKSIDNDGYIEYSTIIAMNHITLETKKRYFTLSGIEVTDPSPNTYYIVIENGIPKKIMIMN